MNTLFPVVTILCCFAVASPAAHTQSARDSSILRASNCIPDGGSASLCTTEKIPRDWSMTVAAEENDYLSDDPLGTPTVNSKGDGLFEICIEIKNEGGDLSGPNGVVQNGVGEGDCIEVDLDVTKASPASISITAPISGGNVSASGSLEMTTTVSQDFCPC